MSDDLPIAVFLSILSELVQTDPGVDDPRDQESSKGAVDERPADRRKRVGRIYGNDPE